MDKDEFGRESDPQRFHWCLKWPNCTSRIPALGAAVLTSAEYDALKADAARYRWLRVHSTGPVEPWSTHSQPESLDAAVDAALAAESP